MVDTLGIVVSYNRKELLEKAIVSVQSELAGCTSEIVCIDNGEDGGYDVAKKLGCSGYVVSENNGLPMVTNWAARSFKSQHILLFHDDIVLRNGALEHMKSIPSPIVCGQVLQPDGHYWGEMGFDDNGIPKMFIRDKPAAAKAAMAGLFFVALIERWVWELFNGLDERMALDYFQFDFCLRAAYVGIPTALSAYIADHTGGPPRSVREKAMSQKDIELFFEKWQYIRRKDSFTINRMAN